MSFCNKVYIHVYPASLSSANKGRIQISTIDYEQCIKCVRECRSTHYCKPTKFHTGPNRQHI